VVDVREPVSMAINLVFSWNRLVMYKLERLIFVIWDMVPLSLKGVLRSEQYRNCQKVNYVTS
jgi:hypothetical protein